MVKIGWVPYCIPGGQTPAGSTTQAGATAPMIPTIPASGTQKRATNEILAGRPQYNRALQATSMLREKLKIMKMATPGPFPIFIA